MFRVAAQLRSLVHVVVVSVHPIEGETQLRIASFREGTLAWIYNYHEAQLARWFFSLLYSPWITKTK